jgi:hypothetical protein
LKNPTRKSYIPSEEQLNAAELLINSLDLMSVATNDDGYCELTQIKKNLNLSPQKKTTKTKQKMI